MIEQRTPEWFAIRKGRITGSAVGAILGLSPFSSRDAVLRRMVREYHGAASEFEGNIATDYGTRNEEGAKREYEIETGKTVIETGFHTFEDWLGASPDGFVDDGLIEIKCPFGLRNGGEFKTAKSQPHYWAQMQIQMFVTKTKWCDFYQWTPKETKLERIKFAPKWTAEVLDELKAFWNQYNIIKVKSPEIYLTDMRMKHDALQLLAEYDDMVKAIKDAEERKKELLEKIVEVAGGVDAEINGRKLTLVKKEGAISYSKAIKDLLPDADLESYRGKPTEYWMLGK